MKYQIRHLSQDIFFIAISIGLAIFLVKIGAAHKFVVSLDGFKWLGILVSGSFFTSVFTTAPSVALLGEFALTTPIWKVVLIGGIGSVIGDSIIFFFVRNRLSRSVSYISSYSGEKGKMSRIFKNQFLKMIMPFVGAIVIASPLPNELGVTMLGISKMKKKNFLILSFLLNGFGILVISYVTRLIVGV